MKVFIGIDSFSECEVYVGKEQKASKISFFSSS